MRYWGLYLTQVSVRLLLTQVLAISANQRDSISALNTKDSKHIVVSINHINTSLRQQKQRVYVGSQLSYTKLNQEYFYRLFN
jgi:hypothetical protein